MRLPTSWPVPASACGRCCLFLRRDWATRLTPPSLLLPGTRFWSAWNAWPSAAGFLTASWLKKLPPAHPRVDFEEVKAFKMPLLQQAAQHFLESGNGDRGRFAEFKRTHARWLEDFVLFDVMRQVHKGATWSSWPKELARREAEGLHKFGLEHQRELEVERAIQFAFFEQWRSLHQYCGQRGIKIVGDVAIFVNYDSADVWRNPDLFFLDDKLLPTVVAGVPPPDAFSEQGSAGAILCTAGTCAGRGNTIGGSSA